MTTPFFVFELYWAVFPLRSALPLNLGGLPAGAVLISTYAPETPNPSVFPLTFFFIAVALIYVFS